MTADMTILDACLYNTDNTHGDRTATILATLATLKVNPHANYTQYLTDYNEAQHE